MDTILNNCASAKVEFITRLWRSYKKKPINNNKFKKIVYIPFD